MEITIAVEKNTTIYIRLTITMTITSFQVRYSRHTLVIKNKRTKLNYYYF